MEVASNDKGMRMNRKCHVGGSRGNLKNLKQIKKQEKIKNHCMAVARSSFILFTGLWPFLEETKLWVVSRL